MVNRICKYCEKTFATHECEVRREGGKFCSHKCALASRQTVNGINFKTGTMIHKRSGYVLEWNPKHPHSTKGYVPQHRAIMERHLGRVLSREEHVHHINEIKNDNRIENLQVMSPAAHRRHHATKNVVILNCSTVSYTEALRLIGVDKSTANRMKKRRAMTHQQTVDHYADKRGVKL